MVSCLETMPAPSDMDIRLIPSMKKTTGSSGRSASAQLHRVGATRSGGSVTLTELYYPATRNRGNEAATSLEKLCQVRRPAGLPQNRGFSSRHFPNGKPESVLQKRKGPRGRGTIVIYELTSREGCVVVGRRHRDTTKNRSCPTSLPERQ